MKVNSAFRYCMGRFDFEACPLQILRKLNDHVNDVA